MLREVITATEKALVPAVEALLLRAEPLAERLGIAGGAARSNASAELSTQQLRDTVRGLELAEMQDWAQSAKRVINAFGDKSKGSITEKQLVHGMQTGLGDDNATIFSLHGQFDSIATSAGHRGADRIDSSMIDKYSVSKIDQPINYAGMLAQAKEILNKNQPQFLDFSKNLSEGIKSQRWSTVIGDDVSGRIPALVVRDQARMWANDHGLEAPNLLFLASGKGGKFIGKPFSAPENLANIVARVEQNKDMLGSGRALVVTEQMGTGESIARICNALKGSGCAYDVATVQSVHRDYLRSTFPSLNGDVQVYGVNKDANLYSGGAGGARHPLRVVTGVEKYGSEAHTRPSLTPPEIVSDFRQHLSGFSKKLYEEVMAKQP